MKAKKLREKEKQKGKRTFKTLSEDTCQSAKIQLIPFGTYLWLTLDLPFGSGPEDIPGEVDVIYRDDNSNKTRIYVANSVSKTVSVISI